MTFGQFDEHFNKIVNKLISLSNTKGRAYAGTAERFDNFNRMSARLNIHRDKVLHVYLQKHLDALDTYIANVDAIKAGVYKYMDSESITGRIEDAILYLMLLHGMITEEDQLGKEAQMSLHDAQSERGEARMSLNDEREEMWKSLYDPQSSKQNQMQKLADMRGQDMRGQKFPGKL